MTHMAQMLDWGGHEDVGISERALGNLVDPVPVAGLTQ